MAENRIYDLLIRNAMILTMDANKTYYENGYIAVEGSKIATVGSGQPDCGAKQVIDGEGCVAMPGFFNTHTHMGMGYLRGFADDCDLFEFLEKTFSIVIASGTQDVYDFIMLAAAEMIRSGYIGAAEMIGKMPTAVKAFTDCGMRVLLGPGGVDFNDESKVEGIIRDTSDCYEKYNGAGDGRVRISFTIHAPYDCSRLLLQETKRAADALKADIQVHLAENKEEIRQIRERYNMTPTEYLESLGLLAPNLLAAHFVQVTERDMDMAKDYGIRVSHNIGSNLKLASGIAPVQQMLQRGIPVGLGTDSNVTNNRLDAFDTMKTTALVHKGYLNDATVLPAYTVLEMATSMGAKAAGMGDITGTLEVGKCADIILVRMKGVGHLTPLFPQSRENIVSNLVYAAYAEDVDTSVINGKIVMKNKIITAFDEQKIITQAQKSGEELLRKSKQLL